MKEAYNEAEKLFKREKFDEALKIIDNSRIQAAQSPELWTLKARCLTQLERDDDAFQAASEVFKVGTDNVGIVNTLGEGHMKHGDYDAACEMFLLAEKFVSDRKDKKHFQKKYTKALVAKRKHDKHMGMKKSASVASTAIASTTKTSTKEAIEESSAKAVEASVPDVAEAEVSINTFPSASSEVRMGRRKGGKGGRQSQLRGQLCKEKETTGKEGEERLSKILVHTMKPLRADTFAEFYTIDLVKDQVIPCPHALPGDFGFSSIAVLGSLIYVIAGYNPEIFDLRLTEEEKINRCSNNNNNLHYYAGSSCLDLNDDSGSGWKPAPPLKFNPTHQWLPISFSLCGKLFAFGFEFGEFFDPKCNDGWCQLLPPPDSGITRFNLSEPIVRDPCNNRFIVRFQDTEALYAYYPDDDKWQLLHPHFNLWASGMAYFDGVLYFYIPSQDVIGAAFDVETKQWLNITFSSKFDVQDTNTEFDALLNLGNGTLCLVAHDINFSEQFKTYVDVLKFRVGRTGARNVIFTPISAKRYNIPTCRNIVNYAAL